MLKLLVVGGNWPPETFIARKLSALAQSGFDVTVAANVKNSRAAVPQGVRVIPLFAAGRGRGRQWVAASLQLLRNAWHPRQLRQTCQWVSKETGGDLRTIFKLLPLIGRHPDIVHFEWNFAAVQYRALFDLLNCPIVVSCRGAQAQVAPHNPERKAESDWLPITLQRATAIHCVSDAIRKEAIHLGGAAEKMHVIRPAVDPSLFCPSPEKRSSDKFRIVTTGAIIWRKGYEYALQTLRLLVNRGINASLTLIGSADKTNRQRLLYTMQDLGLEERVNLPGPLPPASVVAELQSSDAFLLASLSEGISNAVLEAMSCGLPVVTTDCGGMGEAITNGVEGFVIAVRRPEEMADALERLALDRNAAQMMGIRGRERVLRDFKLSDQTQSWVGLYRGLVEAVPNTETYPKVVSAKSTTAV